MSWPLDSWWQLSPHLLRSQANASFLLSCWLNWVVILPRWLLESHCWITAEVGYRAPNQLTSWRKANTAGLLLGFSTEGAQLFPFFCSIHPWQWKLVFQHPRGKEEIEQANRFLFFATNQSVEDTSWIWGCLLCCGSWSNRTKALLTGWEGRVNNAAWHFREMFAERCQMSSWWVRSGEISNLWNKGVFTA